MSWGFLIYENFCKIVYLLSEIFNIFIGKFDFSQKFCDISYLNGVNTSFKLHTNSCILQDHLFSPNFDKPHDKISHLILHDTNIDSNETTLWLIMFSENNFLFRNKQNLDIITNFCHFFYPENTILSLF